MRPIASFIVPVFNEERRICKCINSLLAQTIHDFEVIIVDDGSTDNTQAILKNFTDRRIRVYRQNNSGRAEARNKALHLSRGKYIALQDADDWSEPDRLERQLYLAENAYGKPVVGSGLILHFGGNERAKTIRVPEENEKIRKIMGRRLFRQAFNTFTMVTLRQKLIDVGGWRTKFKIAGEDGDLLSRLYEEKDVIFLNSKKPLYHYILNEGSVTNKFRITIPQQMFMRYCERARRRGENEPENYEDYMSFMNKGKANEYFYNIEYFLRWLRLYFRKY
jgi:glycosyltransferase involved in cell wall biosynthesis